MTTNKGKRYSEDFKKSIVTLHHNGKSINQLSKEYNITHAAITKWVNNYSEVRLDNDTVMTTSQVRELQKRNAQLEEENIILKKAAAIFIQPSKKD